MKIHIVQKGDTLWNIAKKYGVNFEELKQANAQLSNPDMIMPGMKIKVPTGNVLVKKEAQIGGNLKEEKIVENPYVDLTPEPLPVMEEKEMKEQVAGIQTPPPYVPPYQPFEIDINNYNLMNMNMPQVPQMPQIPTPPPNILPGMMAPEEMETEISPAVEEAPPLPPQMPNYCVPITPVMPGYGFDFVPGPQGSFPGGPMQEFPRVEQPGVEADEEFDLPPQMPMAPMSGYMPQQQVAPVQMQPTVPYQPPFPGNCLPFTPVMPGYGFNGYPVAPAGFPGAMPQGQGMPGFVSPDQDVDDVTGPNFQNQPFLGNLPGAPGPFTPFPAYPSAPVGRKGDCGCGGPTTLNPYPGFVPQQGYQPQFGVPAAMPQPGYQPPQFGVNPYQQMPYSSMFPMPDFDDDDLDD